MAKAFATGANLGQPPQDPYDPGTTGGLVPPNTSSGFDWRGGGGGGGNASINYQPPQSYQPYQGSGPLQTNLNQMASYGQGLMDPGSDYFQQLVSQGRQQIGAGAAASKRAAALAGAEQGFGAGASPEMLSMQQGIDESSRIGMGNMMGQMTLAGPRLGAGMMQSTFGPGLGLQQLGEQSSQFGAQLGQQAQQFGTNVGLQQQQLAQQQAQYQAMLRQQMAMQYGGF